MPVLDSSELNRYVGSSLSQYHNYFTNDVFYSLSSTYLRNFYWYKVRKWHQWVDGWVTDFHDSYSGILPTQLASAICDKLGSLIYGAGLLYKGDATATDLFKSLDDINSKYNMSLKSKLLTAIRMYCEGGFSILKLNCTSGILWLDSISSDRFFVDQDSQGNPIHTKSYVNIYTKGIANTKDYGAYGLVEERYYKTDEQGHRYPVVVYNIYQLATANIFTAPATSSFSYKELPRAVQEAFRKDYPSVWLGVEKRLPLSDLGIYLFKYTPYVKGQPNIKLGESAIANCFNQLAKYDFLFSDGYNDLYLTRAHIILPDFMMNNNDNGFGTGYDSFLFKKVPSKSQDNKPIPYLPKMRTEDFEKERVSLCKQMATQIGVSVTTLFPDIDEGTRSDSATATQVLIARENTEQYVSTKRDLILPEIRKLLKQILRFYGIVADFTVTFNEPNSNARVDRIIKLTEAGLKSKSSAIEELSPNSDSSYTEEEKQRIKEENT